MLCTVSFIESKRKENILASSILAYVQCPYRMISKCRVLTDAIMIHKLSTEVWLLWPMQLAFFSPAVVRFHVNTLSRAWEILYLDLYYLVFFFFHLVVLLIISINFYQQHLF